MTIADWLMIAAVLVAPLMAIQAQRRLDWIRGRREAQRQVFYTLMATRAARLSEIHVEALNRIDIDFYGRSWWGRTQRSKKEEAVVTAWNEYLDHLSDTAARDADPNVWVARGSDLFTDLLFAMSRAVGYEFSKVHLKRGIYSPVAHGQSWHEQEQIREGLAKLLSGERPLRVTAVADSPPIAGHLPSSTDTNDQGE